MDFLRNLAYQTVQNVPLIGYLGSISYLLMLPACLWKISFFPLSVADGHLPPA